MKILITGGSGFIGTNLIERLRANPEHSIVNLDNSEPKDENHRMFWAPCDLMDSDAVATFFTSFRPQAVIHLAGRTDTDPKNSLSDYEINIKGTEHLLTAIKNSEEVQRAIITSTQFVHQYHGLPKHDLDFAPHTVYGESKVLMEKLTRDFGLRCVWTIIRPTNIWGPWHIRYPYEFWKVISRGLYVHPGRKPVIRSYGYVGNVVFQIMAILQSPPDKVNKKVFYVGDMPIDILDWVNGFSLMQTGKKATVIPRMFVRSLAWVGDILSLAGIRFPLTSSRYQSMTNSNIAPMEETFRVLGDPPYSLNQGITETVEWMKVHFPELIKIQPPK
jgi:GlcNAc-P-P-Und epimerase